MDGDGSLAAPSEKHVQEAKESHANTVEELCSYCEFKLDSSCIRMHCHVCKDFSLCLNCYLSQAEYKTHNSSHLMYPRTAFNMVAWPDGWTISDDLGLLEAIEINGIGSWEAIHRFMHRPAHEPLETIIRHFNYIFSDTGIMGAQVLDTLTTEAQEQAFLQQLPPLATLQQYSEMMDAYSMHIWREVQAIKGRGQLETHSADLLPNTLPMAGPIELSGPSKPASQSSRPLLSLENMEQWPERATPDIIAAVMEYLRAPPPPECQALSQGFKTVPQSVYDNVMRELPDNYSTLFKDFILAENAVDLGLITPDVCVYPRGVELRDIPHNSGEGDGKRFVHGSWPLRRDFTVEYVNKAEYPLMFMRIFYGKETKLSMQLKVRTLQAYVVRLLEREKRKRFVFQFSLHRTDFAIDELTLATDEETIRRQGREKKFALPLKIELYNPTDILINKFEANHSWLLRAFSTRLEFRQFAALHIQDCELRRYIHTLQIARFLGLRTLDQLIDVDVFMRNPLLYGDQYGAQNELRRRLPLFLYTPPADGKEKPGSSSSANCFFESPGQRQSIMDGICMSLYLQNEFKTLAFLNAEVDNEQPFIYFAQHDAGREHAQLVSGLASSPAARYASRLSVDVDPGTNTGVMIETMQANSNHASRCFFSDEASGRFGASALWYLVDKAAVVGPLEQSKTPLTLEFIFLRLFKFCGGSEVADGKLSSIGKESLVYRVMDLIYKLFCISKTSVEVVATSRLSCGAVLTVHLVGLSVLSIMSAIAYNNSFMMSLFNDDFVKYARQGDSMDTRPSGDEAEPAPTEAGDAEGSDRARQESKLPDQGGEERIKEDPDTDMHDAPQPSLVNKLGDPVADEPPLKRALADDPLDAIEDEVQRKAKFLSQLKPVIANTLTMDAGAHYEALILICPWLEEIFVTNKFLHDSKRLAATTSKEAPPTSLLVYQAFVQWLSTIMAKGVSMFSTEQQTQYENSIYAQIGGAQATMLQMLINIFKDSTQLRPFLRSFTSSFLDTGSDVTSADIELKETVCATGAIVDYTIQKYRSLMHQSTPWDTFFNARALGHVTYTTLRSDRVGFNNVHVFSNISFCLQVAPMSSLLCSLLASILPHTIMAYGLKSPFVASLLKLLTDRRSEISFEVCIGYPEYLVHPDFRYADKAMQGGVGEADRMANGLIHFLKSTHSYVDKEGLDPDAIRSSIWLPSAAYGLFISSAPQPHRKKIFEAYRQASYLIACTEQEMHYRDKNLYMFYGSFKQFSLQEHLVPYEMCTTHLWLSLRYLPSVADTDAPYYKATQKLKKIASKCANINPVTIMASEYQIAKLSKAEYKDLRIRLCTTDRKIVLYTLRDYSRDMFFKICDTLLTLTQQKLNILVEQNRYLLANDPFYRDQTNVRQSKRTTPGQAGRNIIDAFNHSNIALITSQFDAFMAHDHFLLRYDNPGDAPRGCSESSAKSRTISEKLKLQGLDPSTYYIIEPKEYLFGPVMPRKSYIQADSQNRPSAILPINMRPRMVKPHQMRYLHSSVGTATDLMSHNEFCSRYLTRGEVIFLALSEIDIETYLFAKESFIASGYIITRTIFSVFDCRPGACEIMAILVISALCSQSAYSTVPMMNSFDNTKIDYSVEWAHCTPYHLFLNTLGDRQARDENVSTEITAHTDIKLTYGTREISTISNLRLPKAKFEPNIMSVDSLNIPATLLQKANEIIDKDSLDKAIRSYRSIFLQSHFNQDYRAAASNSLGSSNHEQHSNLSHQYMYHPSSGFPARSTYTKSVLKVSIETQTVLSFWRDEKAKRVQKILSAPKPVHQGHVRPPTTMPAAPGAIPPPVAPALPSFPPLKTSQASSRPPPGIFPPTPSELPVTPAVPPGLSPHLPPQAGQGGLPLPYPPPVVQGPVLPMVQPGPYLPSSCAVIPSEAHQLHQLPNISPVLPESVKNSIGQHSYSSLNISVQQNLLSGGLNPSNH